MKVIYLCHIFYNCNETDIQVQYEDNIVQILQKMPNRIFYKDQAG